MPKNTQQYDYMPIAKSPKLLGFYLGWLAQRVCTLATGACFWNTHWRWLARLAAS